MAHASDKGGAVVIAAAAAAAAVVAFAASAREVVHAHPCPIQGNLGAISGVDEGVTFDAMVVAVAAVAELRISPDPNLRFAVALVELTAMGVSSSVATALCRQGQLSDLRLPSVAAQCRSLAAAQTCSLAVAQSRSPALHRYPTMSLTAQALQVPNHPIRREAETEERGLRVREPRCRGSQAPQRRWQLQWCSSRRPVL